MAAGNVAGFVGDDAFQLLRRVGRNQQASMQVDALSVRDKGVQARIIDDVQADILRLQTSNIENRIGPLA